MRFSIAAITMLALAFTVTGSATELLINGGFETGDFTGWTVVNQAGGSGTFSVSNSTTSPISGHPDVGPASGSFFAISDQGGPGAHVLEQSFTVPLWASDVTLSYDMFVNDWAGAVFTGPLDYTGGATEHGRVDLMANGSTPFDTGAGVIQNFYDGADSPLGASDPYTHYSFDITGLVVPGDTYLIRFGESDNQLFFNQGVDNVSINATPEPASLLLFAPALGGLLMWRKRRAA